MSTMKTARPYRSHKYPACTRCHKRRSRCTIEVPGQACLLCRMHGVPCSSASTKKDDKVAPKVGFIHRSLLPDSSTYMEDVPQVVGPVIARDTQVLDRYLGTVATSQPVINNNHQHQHQHHYHHMMQSSTMNGNTMSHAVNKPIYHEQIPPRRPSPVQCACSRNLPGELLDQVTPFFTKLTAMYFEHLYPAFPVLEEECFLARLHDGSNIPITFLVNFSAYALFYWDMSIELSMHHRPDQDFAWQVALSASTSESRKGGLPTIASTIFNVAGRPSKGVINNMTDVSRMVALSHSIGLNHDCSDWKVVDTEKRLRWKLWWAVLIHDRWFNFAQGTPPYISKAHYDVPLPNVQLLAADRANIIKHSRAAQCYIELCKLTEIVGDVLPLIYHIRSGNDNIAAEQTSRSEIELSRWVDNRPKWLDLNDFETRPGVPGLANLQLSYLSVRMLLRRIAWHEMAQRESDLDPSWLLNCKVAAEELVRFVSALKPIDFVGFWLPYNAHHFTSAVTLLLRCGLQTSDQHVRGQSMTSARTLVDCLRRYKEEYNWDMAEIAVSRSENVLRRIETALPKSPQAAQQNGLGGTTPGTQHVDETFWNNPLLQYQGFGYRGEPEELFADVFGDFIADTSLFESETAQYH